MPWTELVLRILRDSQLYRRLLLVLVLLTPLIIPTVFIAVAIKS